MEIKIAICDDESRQAEYIKMLANKWSEQKFAKVQVTMFGGAENFKAALSDGKEFDILLLDIQMGGQNGVELARELRESDDKTAIIFITALAGFISEGYEVSALHYLVKPVDEHKLFETLDKAYKNLTRPKKFLIVNSEGRDCRILFDDILYIEAYKHYVTVVTSEGTEYETRRNISAVESELDDSFFRCQRSYIVMLKHVKHISKTEALMDNGKTISLSRNIYKDLYKAFIRYFKGKEEFWDEGGGE